MMQPTLEEAEVDPAENANKIYVKGITRVAVKKSSSANRESRSESTDCKLLRLPLYFTNASHTPHKYNLIKDMNPAAGKRSPLKLHSRHPIKKLPVPITVSTNEKLKQNYEYRQDIMKFISSLQPKSVTQQSNYTRMKREDKSDSKGSALHNARPKWPYIDTSRAGFRTIFSSKRDGDECKYIKHTNEVSNNSTNSPCSSPKRSTGAKSVAFVSRRTSKRNGENGAILQYYKSIEPEINQKPQLNIRAGESPSLISENVSHEHSASPFQSPKKVRWYDMRERLMINQYYRKNFNPFDLVNGKLRKQKKAKFRVADLWHSAVKHDNRQLVGFPTDSNSGLGKAIGREIFGKWDLQRMSNQNEGPTSLFDAVIKKRCEKKEIEEEKKPEDKPDLYRILLEEQLKQEIKELAQRGRGKNARTCRNANVNKSCDRVGGIVKKCAYNILF